MPACAVLAIACALAACQGLAPEPREVSSGHLGTETPPAPAADIPKPVRQAPFVPPPAPSAPTETYTVVVNDVPVKELLFALARDASLNVDIHPDVSGFVTLNAVDQTLGQILTRISDQLDLRYEIKDDGISIRRDTPFVRMYRVDYVNLSREATTSSTVATNISSTESGGTTGGGGGGGGGNNSTTTVTSSSSYPFWDTLVATIRSLLAASRDPGGDEINAEQAVIANAANGILMVRATTRQHAEIQEYLDEIQSSSRRQVLIEATIVEVELSDDYTAGVDWASLAKSAGTTVQQSLIAGAAAAVGQPPFFLLQYADQRDALGNPSGDLSLTVRLLKQFGEAKVLSSPKIMTLNNQTALLKVVENVVYFEVKSDSTTSGVAGTTVTTADTTAKSVSVGVVMSVTPQINKDDDVTLVVRPTISRVSDFVDDPNPSLIPDPTNPDVRLVNRVPEIAVREMESVLRVGSGQLAVLGGLMQDDIRRDSDGVPILSESETFGEAFTSRNNQFVKTELVIFLRPWVIRTPDVRADLRSFAPFLPENIKPSEPVKSRFERNLP